MMHDSAQQHALPLQPNPPALNPPNPALTAHPNPNHRSGSTAHLNYGWQGSIATFLSTDADNWLQTLTQNYYTLYRQRSATTQQQAWIECGEILRSQLAQLLQARPTASQWHLIFEYELPSEGGRRPDVVLLSAGQILVFEFKQKATPTIADFDQVAAYARDLAEYHSESAIYPVHAIVIPTRTTRLPIHAHPIEPSIEPSILQRSIEVLPPSAIAAYLAALPERNLSIDPNRWMQADYSPLPTVVQAARQIFQNEPLPQLKRAHSAGIPKLLEDLHHLAKVAAQNKQRHLVLITGVPGAGKTLVGLQVVHQTPQREDGKRDAIFLTGNGPLLTVLQYALRSKAFVQAVRNFYIQHEARRQSAPQEHIIVFDEAQRAWDRDRMFEKYGISSAASGAVIRICDRIPEWCVLVGLIGEGQQIHVGEEDGIEQWNLGFDPEFEPRPIASPWHVHCAPNVAEMFTQIPPDRLHSDDRFNLTTSLRTHRADQVQQWVSHLLEGSLDAAASIVPQLKAEGFDTYFTRELESAKTYCRDRYGAQPDKRYGLIASSRARNLAKHSIPNDYVSTQTVKVGEWYIDPPNSPLSCCALNRVTTEFGCQGLELDFPIVCWGNDLIWKDGTWISTTRQKNVRDPLRLRLNSYRVLLTRGRDGWLIFIPPDRQMNETAAALEQAGLSRLS